MNEIQVFDFNNSKVRTVVLNNQPYFVGKDVAEVLGYKNMRDALSKHVDNEDKGVAKCDTLGGKQDLTVINESGVYSLVFGSKLPQAKEFKRWVTSEVLPTIRKHGAYMSEQTLEQALTNPDFLIKLATELKEEKKKREELEEKNKELKPKALFADAVSASDTSILVGDLAKLIKQNGVDIGQKRLFSWLRDNGFLIKRKGSDWNMPTQKSMDMNLFEIKESTHVDGNGVNITTKTPKVTGKGQVYFVNKFLNKKELS